MFPGPRSAVVMATASVDRKQTRETADIRGCANNATSGPRHVGAPTCGGGGLAALQQRRFIGLIYFALASLRSEFFCCRQLRREATLASGHRRHTMSSGKRRRERTPRRNGPRYLHLNGGKPCERERRKTDSGPWSQASLHPHRLLTFSMAPPPFPSPHRWRWQPTFPPDVS